MNINIELVTWHFASMPFSKLLTDITNNRDSDNKYTMEREKEELDENTKTGDNENTLDYRLNLKGFKFLLAIDFEKWENQNNGNNPKSAISFKVSGSFIEYSFMF